MMRLIYASPLMKAKEVQLACREFLNKVCVNCSNYGVQLCVGCHVEDQRQRSVTRAQKKMVAEVAASTTV